MNKDCAVLLGILLLGVSSFSTPLLANTPDGFTDNEWTGIQSVIEADRYRARAVAGESVASDRIEAYTQSSIFTPCLILPD